MYVPEHFAEADLTTLHAFMRQHSFATLVTQHDGAPFASHLPMFLDAAIGPYGAVFGHLARGNPQWQDLAAGAEALVMFQGPHAYVSPAWYVPNPMVVPTWNFMAVHAYGSARILPQDELAGALHQLVDEHEQAFDPPWKLQLSESMRERTLGAIVGFEIRLGRIEGKFKLSQNRSEQDRRNVIAQLSQSTHGREIAQRMSLDLERK
ncbi:protease synthase and sporulation protein PAI 2 [Sideroxyarcus emersonii]|uniref:Protease synthase and sporulation protein PAI 2 n=1 Tax=Sideroxyarcus emersonii TaxID=2764705 RepID=A0AAN1XAQ9_9PROT|nr:FMN-binding negative transcriptional regulator [Sideroxyarcus emersonii]BCK88062.1 protease synthase and sporulation protein PAI 2 [Sideroxyarcus emersonii]